MISKKELDELLDRFPEMKPIAGFSGTVEEFYLQYEKPFTAPILKRQDFLLRAIRAAAAPVCPEAELESIEAALKENYLVSSAEHHASISFNETLNIVLNQYLIKCRQRLPVISLSCATTAMTNELYPRGIVYRDFKIPFAARNTRFAYNAPPMNRDTFFQKLKDLKKDSSIMEEEFSFLQDWFESQWEFLDGHDFLDQISLLNKRLWRDFLAEDAWYPRLNYFMIPLERVVHNLLMADWKAERLGWVFALLFSKDGRELINRVLDGTRSCWDNEKKTGTFFFWGIRDNGRPEKLFLKDDFLLSADGSLRYLLEAEAIMEEIQADRLVASTALFFLYVVFFCGLTAMGGILQVNYLAELKHRLLDGNPLGLAENDLSVIRSSVTGLYANFQGSPWTDGGISRIRNKLSRSGLEAYGAQNHFSQIQECLEFLYHFSY